MVIPDRNNPYSFDAYLERAQGFDFYADDPFVQKVLRPFAAEPPFRNLDDASRRQAKAWEDLIVDVFRTYQETALQEVGPEPIVGPQMMHMPEIWR